MRTITLDQAERSLASAKAAVASARQAVLDAVNVDPEFLIYDRVNREVLSLAVAEGKRYIALLVHDVVKGWTEEGLSDGEIAHKINEAVLPVVLQGPDDTWSGRSNDARRAYFDGVRQAAQQVVRGF